jgi:hypothetical protein
MTTPDERSSSSESSRRGPLFILILFVVGLGAYASWLNRQFYLHQAPFFDSASYTNHLARVAGSYRTDGFKEALDLALDVSTAPLPGAESLALAVLHVPTAPPRELGIWLQAVWLLALAVSLYLYWTNGRGRGLWESVLLTLPFLTFQAMFLYNGGLPDFRLDLSLYFFLSLSAVWYLRTYDSESRLPWVLAGWFAMLACLSRATAPVYWTAMFAPLIAIRLVLASNPERKRILAGLGWLMLPIAAVAAPYFLTHFSYLYYYYAQWNLDAGARLPLRAGIGHISAAMAHVGYAGGATLFFFIAALWQARKRASLRSIDWKLLYLGCAPVLLLVLEGAGLNPFVSMPAVFGSFLFLLAPIQGRGWQMITLGTKLGGIALAFAAAWNIAHAPGQVSFPHTNMAALREAIDRMTLDASQRKLATADFVSLHNWNFHPQFVRNVLINEYGYEASHWSLTSPSGVRWEPYYVWDHPDGAYEWPFTMEWPYTAATPLVWRQEVPGENDDEKINWLAQTAIQHIDYIFVPDDATIDFLEKYISNNFVNTKVRAIKKRFLETGAWEMLGLPLEITNVERVEIYRKKDGFNAVRTPIDSAPTGLPRLPLHGSPTGSTQTEHR